MKGIMRKAAVMLIIQDGTILSISRRDDPSKFGLPGGKVAENETTQQAAIRETFEETSIVVNNCCHFFTREDPKRSEDGVDFSVDCFYALSWEGEPTSSEEGIVKFLCAEELTNHDIGAFADYNARTLQAFKQLYPDVLLLATKPTKEKP